jgi:hypothetical protein
MEKILLVERKKMATDAYAQLSEDNRVTQVIMADDLETAKSFLGDNTVKVANWADLDWIYLPETDRFIAPLDPQFDGFVWDEEIDRWVPPHLPPNDGKRYMWDATVKDWQELTEE